MGADELCPGQCKGTSHATVASVIGTAVGQLEQRLEVAQPRCCVLGRDGSGHRSGAEESKRDHFSPCVCSPPCAADWGRDTAAASAERKPGLPGEKVPNTGAQMCGKQISQKGWEKQQGSVLRGSALCRFHCAGVSSYGELQSSVRAEGEAPLFSQGDNELLCSSEEEASDAVKKSTAALAPPASLSLLPEPSGSRAAAGLEKRRVCNAIPTQLLVVFRFGH